MDTTIKQTAIDLIASTDKKYHNVQSLLEVIAKQPEKVEEMIDAIATHSAANDDGDVWVPVSIAAGAIEMLMSAVWRGVIEGGPFGERHVVKLVPEDEEYVRPHLCEEQDVYLHIEV